MCNISRSICYALCDTVPYSAIVQKGEIIKTWEVVSVSKQVCLSEFMSCTYTKSTPSAEMVELGGSFELTGQTV